MKQLKVIFTIFGVFCIFVLNGCGGGGGSSSSSVAPLRSAKAITVFSLNGTTGVITGQAIAVTMPFGTNLTALIATFTTSGKSVTRGGVTQISGATSNDYTNPVRYIVTAEDGSTATYTVTVTVASGSSKAITAFSINGIPGVITGQSITVHLPNSTPSVTALVAVFNTNGVGVAVGNVPQTSGTTSNDFRAPVRYAVMAEDGSTAAYTVTVMLVSASSKAITAFSLNGTPGVITGQTIAVYMPNNTLNLTALIATFSTNGVSVVVDNEQQTSGETSNDFTNPVRYVVTAEDGSTATYTVTVTVASVSDKAITAFSLNGTPGVIIDQDITVTLPNTTTDVTGLIASFTTNGVSVVAGNTHQTSGETANDFTSPVDYVVTAADGSITTYTVTVTVASSQDKMITAFSLNGIPGVITNQEIVVTLPNTTTDVTGLIASFTTNGVGVFVGAMQQTSGETFSDFTSGPVSYVVTAADGTRTTYTVTVIIASSSAKAITAFSLNGIQGVITDQDITVTLPSTSRVRSLIATFTTSGTGVFVGSLQQTSGATPNNFTAPVSYVVTAADGSTTTYTVTVDRTQ